MPIELFGDFSLRALRERRRKAKNEERIAVRHRKAVTKRRKRKRGGPK